MTMTLFVGQQTLNNIGSASNRRDQELFESLIFHEVGHLFSLADLYVEDSRPVGHDSIPEDTLPGQDPKGIMADQRNMVNSPKRTKKTCELRCGRLFS